MQMTSLFKYLYLFNELEKNQHLFQELSKEISLWINDAEKFLSPEETKNKRNLNVGLYFIDTMETSKNNSIRSLFNSKDNLEFVDIFQSYTLDNKLIPNALIVFLDCNYNKIPTSVLQQIKQWKTQNSMQLFLMLTNLNSKPKARSQSQLTWLKRSYKNVFSDIFLDLLDYEQDCEIPDTLKYLEKDSSLEKTKITECLKSLVHTGTTQRKPELLNTLLHRADSLVTRIHQIVKTHEKQSNHQELFLKILEDTGNHFKKALKHSTQDNFRQVFQEYLAKLSKKNSSTFVNFLHSNIKQLQHSSVLLKTILAETLHSGETAVLVKGRRISSLIKNELPNNKIIEPNGIHASDAHKLMLHYVKTLVLQELHSSLGVWKYQSKDLERLRSRLKSEFEQAA
jgi:hypothetical protein